MAAYTTDKLLAGVKRRLSIPANQYLLDDEDMLAFADDVIQLDLMPAITSLRQDFMVRRTRTSLVSDQASYEIPYRAVGQTLRDLKLRWPDSTTAQPSSARSLNLYQIEDEHIYREGTTPHGFYFEGDMVILTPTPPSDLTGYELEFWFQMRIGDLVKAENCAVVTNISGDNVTVSSVPSTIEIGTAIDFVRGQQGHNVIDFDKVVTNIAGNILTFNTDEVPNTVTETVTSVLKVGDYICPADTTPVIPLPRGCFSYLETGTALRVAESIGDDSAYAKLDKAIDREREDMQKLLAPRIRGENTKIINRNGLLRGRRYQYRGTGLRSL